MWLRAWCFSLVTWKVPDPICQPGSEHSAEWSLKLRTWPPSESCKSRRGNDSLKDCGCAGNEVVGSEANDIICQTHQDTVAALFPASRKRWHQTPSPPPSKFYQLPIAAFILSKEQGSLNLNPWTIMWKSPTLGFLWKVCGPGVSSFPDYLTDHVFFFPPQNPVWFSSLELIYKMPVLQLQLELRWMGTDVWETTLKQTKTQVCFLASQFWQQKLIS